MLKKEKNKFNGKIINTLIGPETSMKGKLYAKGIIRIEGFFKGEIETENDLIIGEHAYIKGNINCLNATIAGRVEGNIEAKKKIEVLKSGILFGDINTGSLMMEDGSFFSGKCLMNDREEKLREGINELSFFEIKKNEQINCISKDNNGTQLNGKEKFKTIDLKKQLAKK